MLDSHDDQYHKCLILTARYLARHNEAHSFAEAGKGVQLSDWKDQRGETSAVGPHAAIDSDSDSNSDYRCMGAKFGS